MSNVPYMIVLHIMLHDTALCCIAYYCFRMCAGRRKESAALTSNDASVNFNRKTRKRLWISYSWLTNAFIKCWNIYFPKYSL